MTTGTKTSQNAVVDGRIVKLTNLDKLLWPEAGVTKADLVKYLAEVSEFLLPHIEDRILTVTRYPDGVDSEGFYQKQYPAHAPDWVQTFPVHTSDPEDTIDYILPNDRPTLVWLANQACIELHPSLGRIPDLLRPDRVVFDLDPAAPAGFAEAVEVAFAVKAVLTELGLTGFVKTSGATGLHIYIAVEPRYNYRFTSTFVGCVGEVIARLMPELATVERLVKNRTGRVYIDHLQNLAGKTIVSPYSPRPLPGAPVSMPVLWEELPDILPEQFTIGNALKRLSERGDLFAGLLSKSYTLDHIEPLIRDRL